MGIGYASFAEDVQHFKDLPDIPMDLKQERLDDGEGTKAILWSHKAQWHKTCHLKFNKRFEQYNQAHTKTEKSPLSSIHT